MLHKYRKCSYPGHKSHMHSFLWTDSNKRTFSKLRVAFNNAYRKILIYQYGVVQVQSVPETTSAIVRQREKHIYL